jgi:predicted O-methyltransferase YrrM
VSFGRQVDDGLQYGVTKQGDITMFSERIQQVIDQVDGLRDQVDDHWQIPRDEATVLATLALACRCRSILEIGTSYGFSTLHLAAAAQRNGGAVHTIDIDPLKRDAAKRHLEQAGLDDIVRLHVGDARALIATIEWTDPFDMVFIDAVKEQSFAYLEAVTPKLAAHAMIITDNTLTHADDLTSFLSHLRDGASVISCGIPVGNGFELSVFQRGG